MKFSLLMLLLLASCAGIPEDITPVKNLDAERYLGKWYEIARLDNPFEKNLINISAEYSFYEDGLRVINRGYDTLKNEWKEAKGVAYFINEKNEGRLKVSFFRPFYGGYNIFELDTLNYQYSLVCGNDKSYLWILARDKIISGALLERLIEKAKSKGFETDKLIFVKQ